MSEFDTGADAAIQLLVAWGGGDRQALDQMLPLVDEELHRIAAHYLSRERPDHTQPTALVHEAYLRLINQHHVDARTWLYDAIEGIGGAR